MVIKSQILHGMIEFIATEDEAWDCITIDLTLYYLLVNFKNHTIEVISLFFDWVRVQKKSCRAASKQKLIICHLQILLKKSGVLEGLDILNGTIF